MSSDNGYIIRINKDNKYVLQMYFASNDDFPDINDPRAHKFDTLEEAAREYACFEESGEIIEYGLSIDLTRDKTDLNSSGGV